MNYEDAFDFREFKKINLIFKNFKSQSIIFLKWLFGMFLLVLETILIDFWYF